jgi:hypothetical protein
MSAMKTHTGGCHCGAVRYEAQTDLANVIDCDCSHCAKKGFLLSFIPASQFNLLSGEDHLTEYRFNTKNIAHLTCKICGVQSFGKGKNKAGEETISLNVRCLDDVDLATLAVTHFEGKAR